ncbi:MAG TPA: hypothetical protein VFE82_12735 [Ramlibacter sp.]|jgi:fatty acid desaturase|uniref:hypothetical protein n=1 Tax=Ramlibacter sp. TaxID=1917967 RepID=UPI002D2812E8|nr:hypothetical protein [Ramlibacter sp.]HZY19340.1 hypothetical protein [Ramlibacter sp.]
MPIVLTFLLRLLLVAAGLVVAAGALVVTTLLAGVWLAWAGWHRLTGRPLRPFAVRFGPQPGFGWPARRPEAAARGSARVGRGGDVTDVEPK